METVVCASGTRSLSVRVCEVELSNPYHRTGYKEMLLTGIHAMSISAHVAGRSGLRNDLPSH